MVVRNDLSHQRIHSCFVGTESWMQFFPIAGLPSEQPHSQTYNWPWVSCRPKKAQIIFCCLHSSGTCVLIFPIVQTRTLTGLNNSIASKQIQSMSVSRMSVSHITHHWLPIRSKQIQEETPAMKIPIWAKESLVWKQAGLHRSVLQQQTYPYAAAPRAAWKKKGDYKAFETLLFFCWTRLAWILTQNTSQLKCI